MSFRTIVITKQAKLAYKGGYLLIRNEETTLVHLSEIHSLIVESTAVAITAYLLCELSKAKIKVVFCDEHRNPHSEFVSYYGAHNTSKKVIAQSKWTKAKKSAIWTSIIRNKIENQALHLKKQGCSQCEKLFEYLEDVKAYDKTNREGHAAKVYFNALFSRGFSRDKDCDINYSLNYGYAILLSCFNREVVSNGYITQLGLKHKNEYNHYNLSSDLMEPFRVIVDEFVFLNKELAFNATYKRQLVDLLNIKIGIDGKNHYLNNAIAIYVRSVFQAIDSNDVSKIKYVEYV